MPKILTDAYYKAKAATWSFYIFLGYAIILLLFLPILPLWTILAMSLVWALTSFCIMSLLKSDKWLSEQIIKSFKKYTDGETILDSICTDFETKMPQMFHGNNSEHYTVFLSKYWLFYVGSANLIWIPVSAIQSFSDILNSKADHVIQIETDNVVYYLPAPLTHEELLTWLLNTI